MNCNTTHYRANSSSVPGDPTGEKKIDAVSVLDDRKRYKANPHDDYAVVSRLHHVLSEADVIVAHNGDKFDTKWLAGRVLYHGLKPFPPVVSIDTYKVAKRHFYLNSNRLDYLGQYLGVGGKSDTPKGLWMQVIRGDAQAVKTMTTYCKRDVELLEQVFTRMEPFMANAITRYERGCPRCGSHTVQSRGVARTKTKEFRRFQCQDCGGWYRDQYAGRKLAPSFKVL